MLTPLPVCSSDHDMEGHWKESVKTQSIFINWSILACDHFILSHWSFQTVLDNGTDTQAQPSLIAWPSSFATREPSLPILPPPTNTHFCFSLSHAGSRIILSHLSLGFDNACLQRHDPLSVAIHHCQQDSSTWYQCTPSQLDPWQWHGHWGRKKKQPVNRTFEHLPANMMIHKHLIYITVGFLVSYQPEMLHYMFHDSTRFFFFFFNFVVHCPAKYCFEFLLNVQNTYFSLECSFSYLQ